MTVREDFPIRLPRMLGSSLMTEQRLLITVEEASDYSQCEARCDGGEKRLPMRVWMGWVGASQEAVKIASTWDEWCADQRYVLRSEHRPPSPRTESYLFSDRELARLSFVRWLNQTGRLDLAQSDTN
jgi:hypothetical protein